jgi:hypothetical protein
MRPTVREFITILVLIGAVVAVCIYASEGYERKRCEDRGGRMVPGDARCTVKPIMCWRPLRCDR